MAGQDQIEGLPEGAVVKPLTPQATATQPEQIEGLPEGATVRPLSNPQEPPTYRAARAQSTPPVKADKSTDLGPLAPPPVTFKDKNATDMHEMSYLDPSTAGQHTNAGKLEGLPGVDARTPTFKEGVSDLMLAAGPLGVESAVAAPIRTAAALGTGMAGGEVGGHYGGKVAEAVHEGAGPTGEDVGSTAGMLLGGYAGEHSGADIESVVNGPKSEALKTTRAELESKQKAYDTAKKTYDAYQRSREQGIEAPEKVNKAYEKARAELVEAKTHHEIALQGETTRPQRAVQAVKDKLFPKKEVPTAEIEAKPKAEAAPAPAPEPTEEEKQREEVREQARRKLAIEHPHTAVEQPLTEKPLVPLGQRELAGGQGTVGMPKLLKEPELEVTPEAKAAEQPKQEVLPPEKPKASKPERGNLRALTVDDTGKVVDKEESTPEGKLGRLLKESLTTDKQNPSFPAIKVTSEEVPREPVKKAEEPAKVEPVRIPREQTTQGGYRAEVGTVREGKDGKIDTLKEVPIADLKSPEGNKLRAQDVDKYKADIASGKGVDYPVVENGVVDNGNHRIEALRQSGEKTAKVWDRSYEPKKEELVPVGAEGREPAKSAAEYHPIVEEHVSHLSDDNLRKLAKAHGLNPDEYDFKARDDHRHRVERDQLVKDIAAQIGDDEKINIGRNAERVEREGKFQGKDMSGKGKAERAASLFPRLRGPVDEFGNPTVAGGAPSKAEDAVREIEEKFPVNPKSKGAATEPKELALMKGEEPEAVFTVAARDGKLRIKGIQSLDPRSGAGTRALKSILDIADKHRLTVELTASPYGDEATRLNSDQLKEWYGKHGFVPEEGKDESLGYMVREPKLPTVSGGAPDGAAAPAEDEEAKRLKAHVEKTSSKDTDHIQAAMKELGADAKLSDIMKRAQELKDSASKPADLKSVVAEHNKKEGLPPVKDNKLEIDPRSKEIARAYDDLKHNPNDPATKKSYDALKKDADKQWDALEAAGIKLEPTDEDPYKSHEEMKEDFEKNKRLKVFRGGNPLPEDHPLAQVDPKTGETYNVKFRAVHDAIGHLLHDNDFSEKGETNAFDTHRQTMSKEAIPAMTTETKGQVANFFNKEGGPNGEFPEQKAGLLPERFYDESPEAKPVLDHIKSGKDFALLTAENPGNERATPEENAKRNKEMKAELEKMGYKPVPVEGHNADVKGEKENSFFVPDIKPEDAEKISKKYGQASVLTKIGIHDLEKNEIHPAGKMIEGPEAAKQDYYSTVGGKAFSIPVNFDTTVAGDIGRWSAPPELGAFSAEDKGQNIRAENERRMGGPLKRGEVERRGGEDRRGVDRTKQKAEQDLFNRARTELGEDATSEEVSKLVDHLRDLPKATAENSRLSDEELLKKGYSQEDLDNGRHLPTVSGAKEGTAKAKKLPTGDELIEKYGESNGDPAHTTFILADGRGVANTGTDHDIMLGGKATDKIPPREKFVDEGNIRVRPRPTGTKGREVSMSLPEKGINQKQLDYILKMAPQLRSGVVGLEVGKRGGAYKILPYGEATDEALKSTIRELVPVLNDKGAPIDEFGNPTVSGGSQSAGTAPAKEEAKESPESLRNKLPKIAQENLTEQEKEGLTTTPSNKARTAGTNKFVDNMEKIPEVQEYVDIALQGEGARKWYSRSRAAFDAMAKVAPDVFKKGDLDKFLGMLAGTSPQQSVAMNLREALSFWKEWHEAGRPELSLDKWKQFGEEADKAWKEDGSPRARGLAKGASMHWDYAPKGDEWKAENLLLKTLTLPETKVPNLIKAMSGEDMWPDLTKNSAFKAPSFAQNLRGWKNYVTNDSWMGLFGGIDKSALSKPENYHPLSVATRAAAKQLGWEPEEAQAAIWSFTQALTEKGAEDPHTVRQYSEDFKDLMENDLQVRNLLEDLGVNLNDLDDHLRGIEEKPEVSGRTTASTSRSVGKLKERIEEARGRGAIPKPKAAQGSLLEQFHKERPAFEHRNKVDADVEFNPKDFGTEDDKPLKKLGEKKNKPKMKSLF